MSDTRRGIVTSIDTNHGGIVVSYSPFVGSSSPPITGKVPPLCRSIVGSTTTGLHYQQKPGDSVAILTENDGHRSTTVGTGDPASMPSIPEGETCLYGSDGKVIFQSQPNQTLNMPGTLIVNDATIQNATIPTEIVGDSTITSAVIGTLEVGILTYPTSTPTIGDYDSTHFTSASLTSDSNNQRGTVTLILKDIFALTAYSNYPTVFSVDFGGTSTLTLGNPRIFFVVHFQGVTAFSTNFGDTYFDCGITIGNLQVPLGTTFTVDYLVVF